MLFNSLTYLVFLTLAVSVYWMVPHRFRQPWLLLCSAVFYCAWRWEYGLLLLLSVVANFHMARWVHSKPSTLSRAAPIVFNLGLLAYYKYLGFFADTFNQLSDWAAGAHLFPSLDIYLPLGISFFTFQGISYVVDVARGKRPPETSIMRFALYICFWAQLVAGPIVRAHEILPQFDKVQRFRYDHFAAGLKLILYGLFIKVVLADGIAGWVDEGFAVHNYAKNSAIDNWTLAFGFGFQIYFDFAGYSMVALGSGRLFGLFLPTNFKFPYISRSPREFWQRWHITLSSWIRDYLYVPLQGRVASESTSAGGLEVIDSGGSGRSRTTALWMTWALMGLWHGANWTFVAWGVWHAVVVMAYRSIVGYRRARGLGPVSTIGALFAFVSTQAAMMASWIFFRAPSLGQALEMLATMVDPRAFNTLNYKENFYLTTFLFLVGFLVCHALWQRSESRPRSAPTPGYELVLRPAMYSLMVLLIVGYLRGQQTFIYFQF